MELVLAKYSHAISAVVKTLELRSTEIASRNLIKNLSPGHMKASRDSFEHQLRPVYQMAVERISALIQSLRKTTYAITVVSQSYALARTINKPKINYLAINNIASLVKKEMQLGGSVQGRVDLALSRLLRDVVDAYQMNQVMGGTVQECLERIERAFPKKVIQKRPPKVMARLKEAKKRDDDFEDVEINTSDFIDQQTWDKALEDYFEDYLPEGRGPYDKVFYAQYTDEGLETYERYQWQVESEMTDDFVDSVRAGENEAANAQGINDFQFIAIVDSKTDDCCFERDGLSTTEIEQKLDAGELEDMDGAISAPLHPFCRCRMAPLLEDMPQESGPNWSEFDDWLKSKE